MTLIFCTASCQGPRIARKLTPPRPTLRTSTKGISWGPCQRVYSSRLTVLPAHASYSLSQIAHHSHHSTRFEAQRSRYIPNVRDIYSRNLGTVSSFSCIPLISSSKHAEKTTPSKPSITFKPLSKCLSYTRELRKSSFRSRLRPAIIRFDTNTTNFISPQ